MSGSGSGSGSGAHVEALLLGLQRLEVGALLDDGLVVELELAHSEVVLAALVPELVLHALEQRHREDRVLGVLHHQPTARTSRTVCTLHIAHETRVTDLLALVQLFTLHKYSVHVFSSSQYTGIAYALERGTT